MTPSKLKALYESNPENVGRHYFSRETMRFFGDTMRNYRVRRAVVIFPDWHSRHGETVQVWALYRHKAVRGLNTIAYFDDSGKLLTGAIEQ